MDYSSCLLQMFTSSFFFNGKTCVFEILYPRNVINNYMTFYSDAKIGVP